MPVFIIGAAIIGGTTLITNSRRRRAAEESENLMNDQIDARNDLIAGYEDDLQQIFIDYEEGMTSSSTVTESKHTKVAGGLYCNQCNKTFKTQII